MFKKVEVQVDYENQNTKIVFAQSFVKSGSIYVKPRAKLFPVHCSYYRRKQFHKNAHFSKYFLFLCFRHVMHMPSIYSKLKWKYYT